MHDILRRPLTPQDGPALTRTDNHRSRRVMEKVGLRFGRELEHAGLPHVLYRQP